MSSEYQRGYEAAYAELYAAIDSGDHPYNCDGCRACGLFRTVVEDAVRTLARKLSTEDFWTLAAILKRTNESD